MTKRDQVVILDGTRVWLAQLSRRLAACDIECRLYRTATGFSLISWDRVLAAVLDVSDASRSLAVAHLAWLWQFQPRVTRIAIVSAPDPTDWALREAGAVAVFHSVFEIPFIVRLVERRRAQEPKHDCSVV